MTLLYYTVFLECFLKATIIPFYSDTTYFAMQAFANFSMVAPFFIAVSGATLGQFVNLGIGYFVLHLEEEGKLPIPKDYYKKMFAFFQGYGKFVLLVSWLPLFNLVTVIAGCANVRSKTALPLIIVGQAAYYSWSLVAHFLAH